MKSFASIEVYNGLGNRLRTIWSACAYAKEYNLGLQIYWPVTFDFPTAHHHILSLTQDISIKSVDLRSRGDCVRFCLEKLLLSSLGLGYERRKSIPWKYTFRPKMPRVPFYWLRTCYEFFPTESISCPFKPSDEVKEIIKKTTNKSLEDLKSVIGIHMRRKDHVRATELSPLSLFVKRIEDYIDSNSRQQFFVCSDEPTEIEELKLIFGEKHIISSRTRFLPRTDPQSALDAMADLFMLSCCKRVLGSYQSSFSSMAGQITGIPVEELCLGNSY